ncbi:MAG TPA: ornithine cyclodeaminase family protein [Ktedonobacteraceae bacterium]|jgi:alanine dehydrogenase|nr:ornithine cyclodeaminase family protein [Ktedonobacteraceae bacterium]
MALILSRADMERCLDVTEVIDVMRLAFRALSTGSASAPQRQAIDLSEQGVALLMPSLLQTGQEQAFGLKIITVMPRNPLRNLPRLTASVLLLDTVTGQTLAIMEGNWLTAMRTGAVSGLATDLLARQDAHTLALFGAGRQAVTQVMAIHAVRPLREVRVVNRNDAHFLQLQGRLQKLLGPACPPVLRVGSSREALEGATLVVCATASTEPLFQRQEVEKGTHINAIGAFTPEMREVDSETLAQARIVVDLREAALIEAGDLLQPLAAGLIPGPETWIELGDLVTGKQAGRSSEDEITFFKSVGVAVQDVATALYVYRKAQELGKGIEVEV